MSIIKTERIAETRVEGESIDVYARIHKLSASQERQLKLLFGDRAARHEIEWNTQRRSRIR